VPPSYFGTAGTTWLDADGLDELVQASYRFIFLERLVGIRIQLLKRTDVDGLVVLNLRHLLSRLQRQADPIGARVFRMLRSAVLAAVDAWALHVLDGDPDVRNDTVLAFDPDTRPTGPPTSSTSSSGPGTTGSCQS
jgi:hypothetical protein